MREHRGSGRSRPQWHLFSPGSVHTPATVGYIRDWLSLGSNRSASAPFGGNDGQTRAGAATSRRVAAAAKSRRPAALAMGSPAGRAPTSRRVAAAPTYGMPAATATGRPSGGRRPAGAWRRRRRAGDRPRLRQHQRAGTRRCQRQAGPRRKRGPAHARRKTVSSTAIAAATAAREDGDAMVAPREAPRTDWQGGGTQQAAAHPTATGACATYWQLPLAQIGTSGSTDGYHRVRSRDT